MKILPLDKQSVSQISRVALALLVASLAGCPSQDSKPDEPPEVKNRDQGFELPQRDSSQSNGETNDSGNSGASELPGPIPKFRIMGAESGLDFSRFDDISGKKRILEVNGGGVGIIDVNLDGWDDIVFPNGCQLPLSRNDQTHPTAVFQNRHGTSFRRISKQCGIELFGFNHGCAVGDYNNDGFDDLYITAFGRNSFWLNNGDGTFQEIADSTGTQVPLWSSSAAFADLNGDGFLDLYVVNYLIESDSDPRLCPSQRSPTGFEGCSPAIFEGAPDVVFFGDGSGGFENVTETCGVSRFKGKGLGVVVCDLNDDSTPEIYVANDGQANFLFVADETVGEIQFSERAVSAGLALSESGYAQASMGVAVNDYDGDGRQDIFLTHFFGDTNTLYRNLGELNFKEETRSSRLGRSSRQTLGFGTVMKDFNNDGWPDLFVANGHVDDRSWKDQNEPWKMKPQIYANNGTGRFLELQKNSGNYFASQRLGRGVAVSDLNRDGRMDLVVAHQIDPSAALINETALTELLTEVNLVGTQSNRNAIGAKVELQFASREIQQILAGGGSFQSASSKTFYLPLTNCKSVKVQWPSGANETFPVRNQPVIHLIEGNN